MRGARGEAPFSDLLIVGAGAKAAAIAAKVDALNRLGLAKLSVTIVEKTEPAASWLGLNGMTSGEEPLAVPPIKDVGFPYRSSRQFPEVGDHLDAALLPLSWQRHSIERGEYAPWVNAGAPPILHRDYGTYLGWVLARATAGVTTLRGRVVAVSLDAARERWVIDVEGGEDGAPRQLAGRALLLTGPGVHRAFPHEPAAEPRVLHCDSRRGEFARLPADREVDVAIVGGGESALSALVFLRAMRPEARITIYTPMLPLSRGESFLENRVFADPDDVGWDALDLESRRDFVKHCDRGVLDAGVIARLAGEDGCRFELGRVVNVTSADEGEGVGLVLETPSGRRGVRHDYVVNCTGFDLLAQLRGLFAEPVRAELEAQVGPIWDRPRGAELHFDRSLALDGMEPRLHIPGLAGLSQGPGFANLGSLGLLANRVLAPLLPALTKAKRGAAVAVLTVLVVALLAGCGGGSSSSGGESASNLKFGETALPGGDPANSRQTGGPIDRQSVGKLKVAWALPLTGSSTYGSYASTPVVSGGVVYSQDLASNVQALELSTGNVLWTHKFESPSHGPNGLAVGDGIVFGATATEAFALNAETGKSLWSVVLPRGSHESIDMAPGYNDGQVYVSTVPVTATEDYGGGAVGVLWALDAKTGKKLWHFNTVPDNLWTKKKETENSGGGLWYPPSFDAKGDVYFGTGNPGPLPGTEKEPWGSGRPGPDLYSDSLVKLDPKTGKLLWYYQQTPHNVYDWDFQDSPVMVKVGGKELAIGAGKSGVVVALDAANGKPVWKTPVGKHNGHDQDSLLAMRGEYSKIKVPAEVFPGEIGGVLSPMATNGKTLFVPVINHSMTVTSGSEVSEESTANGELVAIDLATGMIEWNAEFEGPAYGAANVVNDLVFVTTAEGTVHALDTQTGGEVWSLALPAGTNAGVTVSGDTLLAPAGLPVAEGQKPSLVAYRLGG
ncbi:MAG TPA: PQQ-binding-like beta-propeller repeat protein [Solirubrobacterales bacterium]|nr:PQQ-binding-like beta-propeller repeat protein [Solirubrobacterales bacterium]